MISKMNKDAQMRATINQKLIETGERERLKELLRAKLIECGWKDQLKAHCKECIPGNLIFMFKHAAELRLLLSFDFCIFQ
uniref:Transcription and mRNA export factor ENY2 n=1 Tax=Geospiza parvula TaxID=87175 RepID=A0A8C3MGQ3_GEOPR